MTPARGPRRRTACGPARGAARGAALVAGLTGATPLRAQWTHADDHASPAAADTAAATEPAAAAFVDAARAGTARYRELTAAIADGYRRVGAEVPSMGEHWLHNGRALADTLDATAPPILVYVRINGRPVLAGVAYTSLLAPGAPYPNFPPGHPPAWHDHNGSVDDEVLPLGHVSSPQPTRTGTRIAVMHAWVWVPNPAGVWEPDNWALPYARLGLPVGDRPAGPEARALALVGGGDEYHRQAIARVGGASAEEAEQVRRVLDAHRARAAGLSAALAERARHSNDAAAPAELRALAAVWESLWEDVAHAVRPEVWARLAPLRAALR